MYLTGGQYKGSKIEVPKSARPTLSKVRQSVFNILMQYYTDGATFLDMFAGSAIMGLEALSRGYKVTEIEINAKAAELIKKNYAKIKHKPNLIIANALNYKTAEKYDVIYIDPPWQDNYEPIIKKAAELLNKNGIIIIEYDNINKINLDEIIKNNNLPLNILKSKKYGRVCLELLSFIKQ